MAVTLDSVSNAAADTTSPTSWSHTLGGGSNLVLVVAISGAATTPPTVTSVTYGSQGLSQVTSARKVNGVCWSDLWYLVAPSGNQTITVTLSGDSEVYCGAVVGKDAHQTVPLGTAATNSGTGTDGSVTVTSGTSELAVGCVVWPFFGGDTITTNAGTERWNISAGVSASGGAGATILATASAAFSWTCTESDVWAASGVSIKPAVTASAALTGTATESITEADIVAGGKTVILTLTNDTWVAAAGVGTTPLIEAADVTQSGSNTAQSSWAVSTPAASTGDLLIFHIGWDDSTDTTGCTAPSGKASETLTQINATPVADSAADVRSKMWYCICAGTWTAGTITFTPSASEQWSAHVVRVPAGEFDASTPIGATGTNASTADDSEVDSPAYSAGSTDGGGKLLFFAAVDTDPLLTKPTGWTEIAKQDIGAVASGFCSRDTAITGSESIASAIWPIASDAWVSQAVIVRAPPTTPFPDARAAIRNGLDSAQSEAAGWDAVVKGNIPVGNVVRTSDTVCTITLQAQSDYDITAQETITATIPAAALTGNAQIVATPTFTVDQATGAIALTGLGATAAQTMPAAAHTQAVAGLEATAAQTMPTAVHVNIGTLTGLAATPAQTMPGVLRSKALSGLEGTAQQTMPVAGRTQGLTGQESATAQTMPGVAGSDALAGLEATAGLTNPTVAHVNAIGGLEAAAAGGELTAETGVSAIAVDLAGLEATAAPGEIVSAHSQGLTGLEAQGQIGSSTLVGLQASATAGTLTPEHSNALAGLGATAAVGSLVQTRATALTGQGATAAAGSLAKASSRPVAGLEATAAGGSLTKASTRPLAGLEATAAEGGASAAQSVLLTGAAATAEGGRLTYVEPGAVVVALDGLEAGAVAGDLGQDREHPLLGMAAVVERGEIVVPQQGGANFVGWMLEPLPLPELAARAKDEIEQERRHLAINKRASAVIAEVALEQTRGDEALRVAELRAALEAERIAWKRSYDDALASYRQIYADIQAQAQQEREAAQQWAMERERIAVEDHDRAIYLLLLDA